LGLVVSGRVAQQVCASSRAGGHAGHHAGNGEDFSLPSENDPNPAPYKPEYLAKAKAIAATAYGGTTALETALFNQADCITATGSDETLAEIRRHVPAKARFLGYGHRVSFAFIAHETLIGFGLKKTATAAVTDVVAWNQLGCLSPHVIYAEQGGATPAVALSAFAQATDRARAVAAGFDTHVAKPIEHGIRRHNVIIRS